MVDDKFEYFIKRTEDDLANIRVSLSALHKKTDDLFAFKWQIIGGSIGISSVVSLTIGIVSLWLAVYFGGK